MSVAAEQLFSWQRVWAIVLRYLYLIRRSWPRLIDLAYWPTVQMILWGFINQFFASHSTWVAQAAGVLLGGMLLWDVLFRSQLGLSIVFIEELYARNLGQLFASPLRPYEFACALILISAVRTSLGVGTAALLAVPMYHFSIFDMGLPLLSFYTNLLIFGWSVGLALSAMLLRFGLGIENIAWGAIFALAPLSGIYYPISSLPAWLQPLAWLLPTSHVFEGMRTLLFTRQFDTGHFISAVSLNAIYLGIGVSLFLWMFRIARERGLLLQSGE